MPRAGDVVRQDDLTCRLSDRLGDVVEKIRESGKESCVIVADGNVVLGRVRGSAFDGNPDSRLEEVMESGPTTIRTNEMLEPIVERLRARNVGGILVTTSDGRLVGTLYLSDAERRLDEANNASTDVELDDESSCNCNALEEGYNACHNRCYLLYSSAYPNCLCC